MYTILISLFAFSCASTNNINYYSQLESYRRDSTTWDMTMLTNDLAFDSTFQTYPFHAGVFPTPAYSLYPGRTFHGVGCGYYEEQKDSLYELHSYFYFNENVNDSLAPNIFFEIITYSPTIDTENYSHVHNEIISRNYPDYIGQGRMMAFEKQIDYMAFITHTGESYAIVNMRLFNLNLGKKIIITPQPDGSLRSRQEL